MACSYENVYKSEREVCPALGFQDVTVGVPVEIKPFAQVGKVHTECIGKPIIERGTKICEGKLKETCKFTVSQKIRVEVPMVFGAETEVGEARIECKCEEYPCKLIKKETKCKDYKIEEERFRGIID